MSAFGAVKFLTDTLVAGLNSSFDDDPLTKPFVNMIFSDSPAAAGSGTSAKKGLSLWPYRISRDEFTGNEPLISRGPTLLGIPPLIVDIWYLATPMTGGGDSDQLVLERTLQYVYDLGPLLFDGAETRVSFETPGTDELFRLWSALDIPYALSCVFCARHVAIDSRRPPQNAGRVVERFDRYTRMVTP